MHRSGTSFCVRALQRHGVLLPPNLLTPAADNPDGFQESADLVALNDAWLAGSGAAWGFHLVAPTAAAVHHTRA